MTTAGGTTARARSRRTGCGGFQVFCRVSAGNDGLLQFFNRRCGLRGGFCQISAGVGCRGAPLSVTAQVDGAAIGQFQGHGTGQTGVDLVADRQAVAFNENAADALWGHHENLTNNAFDDGNNTAH
ncbi:hypothetical protein D3C81_1264580 [compost metagenome]